MELMNSMRLSAKRAWNEAAMKKQSFVKVLDPDEILNAVAPHLQFPQPTALTDGDWCEIEDVVRNSLMRDRIQVNDAYYKAGHIVAALRTSNVLSLRAAEPQPAEASPAEAQGDLVDLMREAYSQAVRDGNYHGAMAAALAVAQAHPPAEWPEKRDAEWEAAILSETQWERNYNVMENIRARLSQPTPERVTVVGAVVYLDGKEYAVFKGHDSNEPAEKLAAGLRAELEAKDGK